MRTGTARSSCPTDVTWHGQSTAPASALVEDHHLGFFVEAEMYGDEQP